MNVHTGPTVQMFKFVCAQNQKRNDGLSGVDSTAPLPMCTLTK